MILISVLYQNASTSRILEPSPQGLISSVNYAQVYLDFQITENFAPPYTIGVSKLIFVAHLIIRSKDIFTLNLRPLKSFLSALLSS